MSEQISAVLRAGRSLKAWQPGQLITRGNMSASFKVYVVDDDPVVLDIMHAILEPDCQVGLSRALKTASCSSKAKSRTSSCST